MAPRFLTAVLVLAFAALACVTPERRAEQEATQFMPASGLDQVNPADIAVAPVMLAMLEEGSAPTDAVREALYLGLIDRLYSPLPLDWVDAGGERDAVLKVRILMWDTDAVKYDGTVLARAEARLSNADGNLWGIDITRVLNDATSGPNRDDAALAEASAARDLAAEILALLPERNPLR